MTDEPRIVLGTFVDYRTIKGRKQLQLFIEVPIEEGIDALTKLGNPISGESLWVSVARLTPEAVALLQGKPEKPEAAQASNASISSKPGRKWNDLSLSERAGIRCNEPNFLAFLEVGSSDAAATRVREICKIKSRADLNYDFDGAEAWGRLEKRYEAWLTDQRFGGARHGG